MLDELLGCGCGGIIRSGAPPMPVALRPRPGTSLSAALA
jgi:hypothetical protein